MGEVWLHYVGSQLYSIESFVREARKYGVSRAIPLNMLGKLRWGEKIYLAQLVRKEVGGEERKLARIFGFFTVEWVNLSCSDELRKAVYDDPRVSAKIISTGKLRVERACGSYVISAVATTSADLETVAKVIKEKVVEFGEKVKVFVGGKLTLIYPQVEVEAPFTRSLVRVEFDEGKVRAVKEVPVKMKSKAVAHVVDYVQRRRLTREERRRRENKSLFEFLGVAA